jgi:hypothetical protein
LADTFVIEQNRDTARGNVNGCSVPDQQGVGMIYLNPVSIYQRHREWPKGAPPFERRQGLVEMLRFHPLNPSGFFVILAPQKRLYQTQSRAKEHKRMETPDLAMEHEPPKDSGYVKGEYP